MKTILLVSTFFITSLFGATNVDKVVKVSASLACSNWVEVDPGCDNNFWLCTDGQSLNELVADAIYFSNGRC